MDHASARPLERCIATYIGDADLGANEGRRYATRVAVAYIISRGLAKAGTREPYGEDYGDG